MLLCRYFSLMLMGLCAPALAMAEEPTEALVGQGGAAVGKYQGNTQAGATAHMQGVSIANGDQHKNPNTEGPALSYANLSAGVEVGPAGVEVAGKLNGGWNFWKRNDGQTVVPHVGFEPFNWQAGASIGFDNKPGVSIQGRTAHLEWMPMGAAGVQVFGDTCRAMFSARGGMSVGTFGDNNLKPVYGAGVMGVCKNLLLFNADLTRIKDGEKNIDMATFHAALKIPGQSFSVGAVFEGRDTKDAGDMGFMPSIPLPGSSTAEISGKLMIGGAF